MACTISIVDDTPAVGSIQMMNGADFPTTPRTVPILLDNGRQVGLANIDATGHFVDPIRIPASLAEGDHSIALACGSSTAARTISVVANEAAALRTDEIEAGELALVGFLAIVIALVLTARRRRMQRVVTKLVDAQVP